MLEKIFQYLLRNQILFVLALAGLGWLVIELRAILAIFFIAYIIMAGFFPFVDFLRQKKIPKAIAIPIPYLLVAGGIALLLTLVIPQISSQVSTLTNELPNLLDRAGEALGLDLAQIFEQPLVADRINELVINAIQLTGAVFQTVLALVAIFVVSIYMLVSRDRLYTGISRLFLPARRRHTLNTLYNIERAIGSWLRGQILLSVSVGLLTWLFLWLANVPYSASLALLAAILEFIPYAGPILASIPAIIIGLGTSLARAGIIALGYVVIQQLENHVLQPNIMHRTIHIPALAVIAVVIVGAELWGIIGALLAVPLTAVIKAIIEQAGKEG